MSPWLCLNANLRVLPLSLCYRCFRILRTRRPCFSVHHVQVVHLTRTATVWNIVSWSGAFGFIIICNVTFKQIIHPQELVFNAFIYLLYCLSLDGLLSQMKNHGFVPDFLSLSSFFPSVHHAILYYQGLQVCVCVCVRYFGYFCFVFVWNSIAFSVLIQLCICLQNTGTEVTELWPLMTSLSERWTQQIHELAKLKESGAKKISKNLEQLCAFIWI